MILGILASAGGAASTAYESIATLNGTGSSGTITFSSIPSTYTHLQIRGMAYDGGANNIYIRANGDTGTNYSRHTLYGQGSAASADGLATQAQIDTRMYGGYTTNIMSVWTIDLLDYASTTKYKTFRGLAGYDQNGAGAIDVFSGLWQSTSAVTSISIIDSASNFNTQTTFALYGIKAAA
jgi:hypothetical protein